MILFSGISNAEVYTVLITLCLMPLLFIPTLLLTFAYFTNKVKKTRKALIVFAGLLLVNSGILGLHQANYNEPGLVFFICLGLFLFSVLLLILTMRF